MDAIVACAGCGLDPATDTMLINAAVAAAIGTPWMLRHQLTSVARSAYRRLRGIEPDAQACPLPAAVDQEQPEDD